MRIIAGPCQFESLVQSIGIAEECSRVCQEHGIDYYFKASYDKANRTSLDGERGLGLNTTMKYFREMKSQIPGLKILTDVHSVDDIKVIELHYMDVVDVIQIPAFLCRQTDLLRAACETGLIVNVKKGQFLSPWDVAPILHKCHDAKELWITERGTSFGYNTLVNDFCGMQYLLDSLGKDFVYDVTHSVQKPGANGNSSGGDRSLVPGLARAGSSLGISSFFLEVHPNPESAASDGPNSLYLRDFEKVVSDIVKYHYVPEDEVQTITGGELDVFEMTDLEYSAYHPKENEEELTEK